MTGNGGQCPSYPYFHHLRLGRMSMRNYPEKFLVAHRGLWAAAIKMN